MSHYAELFLAIHGFPAHAWEIDLADDSTRIDGLIRIFSSPSGIDAPGSTIQWIASERENAFAVGRHHHLA